jgi:hypothetical protein
MKEFGNDKIIFPLRKRGIQGDLVFDNGCCGINEKNKRKILPNPPFPKEGIKDKR